MAIRPATSADAWAIAEVQVRSWQQAYAHLLPGAWLASMSVEERCAKWQEVLSAEHAVAVAVTNDVVVGFVSAGACRDPGSTPQDFEVYALYVHPGHWVQGSGAALLRWAFSSAVSSQAKTLSLWVIVGNERAVNFYSRHGFETQVGSHQAFEIAGVPLYEDKLALPVGQDGV